MNKPSMFGSNICFGAQEKEGRNKSMAFFSAKFISRPSCPFLIPLFIHPHPSLHLFDIVTQHPHRQPFASLVVIFDLMRSSYPHFGNCNSHVKLCGLFCVSTKEEERARPNTYVMSRVVLEEAVVSMQSFLISFWRKRRKVVDRKEGRRRVGGLLFWKSGTISMLV